MAKQSAGVLLYRVTGKELQVLLVHPGGPFYKNKDLGAWTIPKGEYEPGEDPLACAIREFEEETGLLLSGEFQALAPIKQKGGKLVQCFIIAGDLDPSTIHSNLFSMEWPPKSGKFQEFPEVDRGEWFSLETARVKILPSQLPLLDELESAATA